MREHMHAENAITVRPTGVLIEDGRILLVRQKLQCGRQWSLPGGKLIRGESLEAGLIREMKEETGLDVEIERLLYICDGADNTLLHITFLLHKTGGELTLPDNSREDNPISDVQFIPIEELTSLGFSTAFVRRIEEEFPDAGRYAGSKSNIGL